MGARAERLAEQVEAANVDVIAFVERCSDEQWRAVLCAGESWPVGVTAHHIAASHTGIAGLARLIANGPPVPEVTQAWIDERNARWSHEFAGCTRVAVLALLGSGGIEAAEIVRGLSDEYLERSAVVLGNTMSAQQVIESILIGHPRGHLESLRAAIGA